METYGGPSRRSIDRIDNPPVKLPTDISALGSTGVRIRRQVPSFRP